ncbi:hypothetical protein NE595_18750, partial [Coprococcus sp. DFI.6.81]|uniref:hypothetical protein n=1 Tax=Coprococcus sp. DFI.6.81 TaxID=2965278 RepID=UPI00210BF31D
NESFLRIVEKEGIEISRQLRSYLFDDETHQLKTKWGNVLTCYVLLAILPEEIYQIYVQYLYNQEQSAQLKGEEVSNGV